MVGVAKAASSLGNILVAGICFFLLRAWNDPHDWNRLLLLVGAMAAVMLLCRIRFEQSPGWLIAHGRIPEAEKAVRYFLGPDVEIGEIRNRPKKTEMPKVAWSDLFKRGQIKKVVFSGVPWACEGLGVYGIGVFLPVLVMALGMESGSESAFSKITDSVRLTTYINLFILPGFVLGLALVNRWYHVRTQTWGFILCALGMAILLAAYQLHWPVWIAVAGFMLFELFLNAGPHLMTFIIPPQIYSVAERGSGGRTGRGLRQTGGRHGSRLHPDTAQMGRRGAGAGGDDRRPAARRAGHGRRGPGGAPRQGPGRPPGNPPRLTAKEGIPPPARVSAAARRAVRDRSLRAAPDRRRCAACCRRRRFCRPS